MWMFHQLGCSWLKRNKYWWRKLEWLLLFTESFILSTSGQFGVMTLSTINLPILLDCWIQVRRMSWKGCFSLWKRSIIPLNYRGEPPKDNELPLVITWGKGGFASFAAARHLCLGARYTCCCQRVALPLQCIQGYCCNQLYTVGPPPKRKTL